MELKNIDLSDLKVSKTNVRKVGGTDTADLEASIKAIGLLQPLLVRPNCTGFEIVAGQRRFNALAKLAEESGTADPVPCIVMEDGDDAAAIEASLAENVSRLPMDEIDQYKAFAALVRQGQTAEEIAAAFGVTERLVRRRLAIANLHGPILTTLRKGEIDAPTARTLTMASKGQQKEWWSLFRSKEDHAPQGQALKRWLFGGGAIPVGNALFDPSAYDGAIVTDLFGDEAYFDDAQKFWALQNTAIAEAKARYLEEGWSEVVILDVGHWWPRYDHAEAAKTDGGRVYVQALHDGEVRFFEGFVTRKEARRKAVQKTEGGDASVAKPEITKAMQTYLDLHRHAAVRNAVRKDSGMVLRLMVAHLLAGSSLWRVDSDPQRADSEATVASLTCNSAEAEFRKERQEVRALLGLDGEDDEPIVPGRSNPHARQDLHEVLAKLIALKPLEVVRILNVVVAEALGSGDPLIEVLGTRYAIEMAEHWRPDEAFFDLLRDKEAINAMVRETAGKATAEAHISSTATVQKKIIRDCLEGNRKGKSDWQPRYMAFPMKPYTKRGGIAAVDGFAAVRKTYGL
ncbi:MAG: ParB/RepB/Spo0J family partition protein [Devosia sp.]